MIFIKKIYKKKTVEIITIFLIFALAISFIDNSGVNTKIKLHEQLNENTIIEERSNIKISSCTNQENLEAIFERKLSDYTSKGYFPQMYKPSLQATYYAIFILDAMGKLNLINQTEIVNYVMAHYDIQTHLFIDDYARRYLDSDLERFYFPLNSLLEVNCYAILTLDILSMRELIDTQDSIDFIWSCYNPEGDYNGFIGQPYSPELDNISRVATSDNTCFAVNVLDLLMESWEGHINEKSRIMQFIRELQIRDPTNQYYGSFDNNNGDFVYSLGPKFNMPCLLSCYYALRSLKVFDVVHTIGINEIHYFLTQLYNSDEYSFAVRPLFTDSLNILGAALGLELSDLTGYPEINRNEVIQFVLSHRNGLGNWDRSTLGRYHELIDIFQIVRSLKESGVFSLLTNGEKDEIAQSILLYKSYLGFSQLSNDYTSLELINAIVNSFQLYDRINELDALYLYNAIEASYFYYNFNFYHLFAACTNTYQVGLEFRTFPIDYYCWGKDHILEERNYFFTNKNAYFALNSLLKLYKLGEFGVEHSLVDLLNEIIDSQFLYEGYECYGAFLPAINCDHNLPEIDSYTIYLEHSYYAIKVFELLVDFLDLGTIKELDFDKIALYDYIKHNYFENDSLLYFKPNYSSRAEDILENTYYMIEILNAIDFYDLNNQKIRNFLLQNVNYSNIKNIYYQFKISQLLDLQIDLNYTKTSLLLEDLYDSDLNEYFLNDNFDNIDQTAFYWVSDMAQNDELKMQCNYNNDVFLGSITTMSITFYNIVYREFDQSIQAFFDCDQLGKIPFEQTTNSLYQAVFKVPETSDCYPNIEGVIRIYKTNLLWGEFPIKFTTYFNVHINQEFIRINGEVLYQANISYEFTSGFNAATDSELYLKIYQNDIIIDSLEPERQDFFDHSWFFISYLPIENSECQLRVILIDAYHPNGKQLTEYTINTQENNDPSPTSIAQSIVNIVIFLGTTGGSVYISYRILKWLLGRRKNKKPDKLEIKLVHRQRSSDLVEDILKEGD